MYQIVIDVIYLSSKIKISIENIFLFKLKQLNIQKDPEKSRSFYNYPEQLTQFSALTSLDSDLT